MHHVAFIVFHANEGHGERIGSRGALEAAFAGRRGEARCHLSHSHPGNRFNKVGVVRIVVAFGKIYPCSGIGRTPGDTEKESGNPGALPSTTIRFQVSVVSANRQGSGL